MPKDSIRQRMRSRRRALDPELVERAGREAAGRFLQLPFVDRVQTVALYQSIDNELSTDPLFGLLRERGKRPCYPVVAGKLLLFRSVQRIDGFVCGRFGIPEPPPEAGEVPLTEIDLFLVPGVAFDRWGHRVGFGGGYYDRTLAGRRNDSIIVGYCYDFQLLERVPRFDHDVVADVVVTEHRVVFPPRD